MVLTALQTHQANASELVKGTGYVFSGELTVGPEEELH